MKRNFSREELQKAKVAERQEHLRILLALVSGIAVAGIVFKAYKKKSGPPK